MTIRKTVMIRTNLFKFVNLTKFDSAHTDQIIEIEEPFIVSESSKSIRAVTMPIA